MPPERDDDEDAAAPLRPAIPRAMDATPKPASSSALAWGSCAVYNLAGELTEFPGRRGVIRYVTSGVRYTPPPLENKWQGVLSEPGRFEMVWSGEPTAARSLLTLRKDIEQAVRTGELENPKHLLLKELDTAAHGLAALAAKLHHEGWSVGLIRPDNLMLLGQEVVPVDLGFTWQGSFGSPPWEDSPGRPAWIEPNAAYAWLYDHPPIRQQFAQPNSGAYPPTSPAEDVRTVGYLLTWLLSGNQNKRVPLVNNPPIWNVIGEAINGRIATADILAERLRTAPPSAHFAKIEPIPVPKPQARSPVRPSLTKVLLPLLLLTAVGLGAGYWYFNRDEKVIPNDLNSNNNNPPPAVVDPLAQLLTQIEQTPPTDRPVLFGLLRQAFDQKFETSELDLKKKRDEQRAKAVDSWISAYREAVTLAADPAKRIEAAEQFKNLKKELAAFLDANATTNPQQATKEQQCLEVISARVRELSGSQP